MRATRRRYGGPPQCCQYANFPGSNLAALRQDGLALVGAENRTAAIYLWGYAAEMTLKAAYFALFGLAEEEVITVPGHIQPAINRGRPR